MKRVIIILVIELVLAVAAAWTFTRSAELAAVPGYWVDVQITAYCLRGTTASGERVSQGSVAASASVPFGTEFYIPDYGWGTILDRGLLAEDQLDIWMPSCYDAIQWGRRRLRVWRLE